MPWSVFSIGLVRSKYAGNFVLKGGVLLAALDARQPTRDIDLAARTLGEMASPFGEQEAQLRAIALEVHHAQGPQCARSRTATGTPNVPKAGDVEDSKDCSELSTATILYSMLSMVIAAKSPRGVQYVDLSPYDTRLHLLQNGLTVSKRQTDVFRRDSAGRSLDARHWLNAESFAGKARFDPDDEIPWEPRGDGGCRCPQVLP